MTRALLATAMVSMGCSPSHVSPGVSRAAAGRAVETRTEPTTAVPGLRSYGPAAGPPPTEIASRRNPFQFAGKQRVAGGRLPLPPLPPADGLPELPLPIARPPLRLLGLVTTSDGQKVAVINLGADLVLARKGEQVGGRFSVTSIAEDAVELTDAIGNQTIRLALP